MDTETQDSIHQAIAALRRLSEAFGQRRQQLASQVGLTEQQWAVLEEISTEHFMPSMFARQRESTPAAVSKIIRQLIDKGMVTVSVSKADGRQRDYDLTEKGQQTMARIRDERNAAIAAIWAKLDIEHVRAFDRFASDLSERLEGYRDQMGEVAPPEEPSQE